VAVLPEADVKNLCFFAFFNGEFCLQLHKVGAKTWRNTKIKLYLLTQTDHPKWLKTPGNNRKHKEAGICKLQLILAAR
jgi:hypothetical protein